MQISLEGKVALITGASKGIGNAIAKSMAESGAKVMLSSRKQDQLEAAASEIEGDTAVFAANVGDVEAADACVAATIETFGGLDILVNNAATNPHYGASLDVDPAKFDKTIQVNIRGPLFWSQAAHRHSFADKPGVILNIASIGGLKAEPGLGIYNTTKAALVHLTRQLAFELGPTRVMGIAPGLVKTDFSALLVENYGAQMEQILPMKRLGDPQDIANLAVFLASDLASWITGQTYVIDGGSLVRGQ